jgi:hypothetical protein
MSVQYFAEASQKFTRPTVTAAAPTFTEAVSVTTLPDATVVTALPPEVTARVVLVAAGACAEALLHAPLIIAARTPTIRQNLPGV